jgi:hypothetical protein
VRRGAALVHDDFGELALVSVIRVEAYLFVPLKRTVGRYAPPLLPYLFFLHKKEKGTRMSKDSPSTATSIARYLSGLPHILTMCPILDGMVCNSHKASSATFLAYTPVLNTVMISRKERTIS